MNERVFKQPGKRRLEPHQVCVGCKKELPVHQHARRGLPGLCDDCARKTRAH